MKKRRTPARRTAAIVADQDATLGQKRADYDPLKPDVFALAMDTREQIVGPVPIDVPIVVAALPVGDLSVVGFEDRIAIDRKQIGDFIGCITWKKERFTRLLVKLAALDFAAVVVESTIADVRARKYRADVWPSFVLGAAAKITTKYGVPVIFAGSLDAGTDYSLRLLRSWWRERGMRPELKATGA